VSNVMTDNTVTMLHPISVFSMHMLVLHTTQKSIKKYVH